MEEINDLAITVGTKMGPLTHIYSLFFVRNIGNIHGVPTR